MTLVEKIMQENQPQRTKSREFVRTQKKRKKVVNCSWAENRMQFAAALTLAYNVMIIDI